MRNEIARLLSKIDLHIHTTFSDGSCFVEDVVRTAEIKGLEFVAVTDHFSEFQELPKRMRTAQIPSYLDSLNGTPMIRGVEAEIFGDGTVSVSPKVARQFDLVIGGVHNLDDRVFWGDSRTIWNPTQFMEDLRLAIIKGMETRLIDILAHPTWLPEGIRSRAADLITDEWVSSVVDAAHDCGVAIEASGAWRVPDEAFIRKCLDHGVKLSVGSDAHNVNMIGKTSYAVDLLKKVGVQAEDVFLPSEGTRQSRSQNS